MLEIQTRVSLDFWRSCQSITNILTPDISNRAAAMRYWKQLISNENVFMKVVVVWFSRKHRSSRRGAGTYSQSPDKADKVDPSQVPTKLQRHSSFLSLSSEPLQTSRLQTDSLLRPNKRVLHLDRSLRSASCANKQVQFSFSVVLLAHQLCAHDNTATSNNTSNPASHFHSEQARPPWRPR